eukprot:Nitzschia sp. Nitz4//scaffold94_size78252//48613//49158//NITZ4_005471-RA/size78252-processed-gene-0.53-mRNA-1//-1//CDS//3329560389//4310//frame0
MLAGPPTSPLVQEPSSPVDFIRSPGLDQATKKARTGSFKRESSPAKEWRVAFNRQAMVRTTLHINNYTDEEFEATWFSQEESASLHRETKRVVKMLEKGKGIEESDTFSARGLACRTSSELRRRLNLRVRARKVVHEEQERQREADIDDPERISYLYSLAAKGALQEAVAKGVEDEVAAAR